jgi:hypothetical protein
VDKSYLPCYNKSLSVTGFLGTENSSGFWILRNREPALILDAWEPYCKKMITIPNLNWFGKDYET